MGELCSLTCIKHEGSQIKLSITLEGPPKKALRQWTLAKETGLSRYHWARIKIDIDENLESINKIYPHVSKYGGEHKDLFLSGAGFDLSQEIFRKIILALNICYPGMFECDRVIRTHLDGYVVEYGIHHALDITVNQLVEDSAWKPFAILDLGKSLNWLEALGFKFSEFCGGPLLNGVHALSQIFQDGGLGNSDSNIIWAMMGLESIFVTSSNVQQNLRDRIPEFLDIDVSQKEIGELYDVRSRYIHGQIAIAHRWLDSARIIQRSKKRKYNMDDVSGKAIYLLMQTLQKSCSKNIVEIFFSEHTSIDTKTAPS